MALKLQVFPFFKAAFFKGDFSHPCVCVEAVFSHLFLEREVVLSAYVNDRERMKCCFNIRFSVILSDSTLRRKSRMSRGVLKSSGLSSIALVQKKYYMQYVSKHSSFSPIFEKDRGHIITKANFIESV